MIAADAVLGPDDRVTLPVGLVNAVVAYLSTRPFGEVEHLIGGIRQDAEVAAPTPPAEAGA